MHKNLLKINKISLWELSRMPADYEFILLLFILFFVNYRKGEICFMVRKVLLKKYISEIIEQDINNKLKG